MEDQEVAVLSLHLLQNCFVYINTLMIQSVLSEKKWMDMMTLEDLRALSPLICSHVNPYGIFKLDMMERIPIEEAQLEMVYFWFNSLLRVVTASLVLPLILKELIIDKY